MWCTDCEVCDNIQMVMIIFWYKDSLEGMRESSIEIDLQWYFAPINKHLSWTDCQHRLRAMLQYLLQPLQRQWGWIERIYDEEDKAVNSIRNNFLCLFDSWAANQTVKNWNSSVREWLSRQSLIVHIWCEFLFLIIGVSISNHI